MVTQRASTHSRCRRRISCLGQVILLWSILSTPALALKSGKVRSVINLVVLHATGGPACDTKTNTVFFTPAGTPEEMKNQLEQDRTVGTHYIVGKEGEVLSSVPENEIANHVIGYNESSIGIELVNRGDGKDPFTDRQVEALTVLISTIAKKYKLQRTQVKTHAELDNTMATCGSIKYKRKQDPGSAFPLQSVRDRVFQK